VVAEQFAKRAPHGAVASERRRGGHRRSSVGFGLRVSTLTIGPKMTEDMIALRELMEKSGDA